MQVDDGDTLFGQGLQERLREYVHPAGQDDQVWALLYHRLGEGGVVPRPRFPQPLRVLLPFGLEAAGDHVEVLRGDAGPFGPRHYEAFFRFT